LRSGTSPSAEGINARLRASSSTQLSRLKPLLASLRRFLGAVESLSPLAASSSASWLNLAKTQFEINRQR
jgi:hypothetical protein